MTSRAAQDDIIPVIDISGLSGDPKDQRVIAAALGRACRETGFFYVVNHGIPEALVNRVLACSRSYFALDLETKTRGLAADSLCRHGYEPMSEQTLEAGTPPDLKEGFSMGPDIGADHPLIHIDPHNHGPNQWPSAPPDFRDIMLDYLSAVLSVSERLLGALALSLNLTPDYFREFSRSPSATLRLLHYPPQPVAAAPGEKGCGAHTDWGAFTLLLQDAAGGLEVQHRELGWVKALPIPGSLVVNIGDLMARWTNGRYKSTMHRVINYSGRERYSVPFFYIGKSDFRISSIPQCLDVGEEPKFPPTRVMDHMNEMVRQTFG